MCAIKMFYLWWDKQDIVQSLSSQAWGLTIKGIENSIRPSFDKRAAMIADDLIQIVEACQRGTDMSAIRVAVTFAYFGFLRISNLAPPTLHQFDPFKHTTFGDVLLQEQGLLLNIKWTKTRQRTKNAISIPLPALGDSLLCPVRAWLSYNFVLRNAKINQNTPLLLDEQARPLSIPSVRKLFNRAVYNAHLEDRGYTPHSLRRGGATFAYHAGVALDSIKHHGTWRSDAVDSYIFAQPIFTTPVATMFAKLLHNYEL